MLVRHQHAFDAAVKKVILRAAEADGKPPPATNVLRQLRSPSTCRLVTEDRVHSFQGLRETAKLSEGPTNPSYIQARETIRIKVGLSRVWVLGFRGLGFL